ncbi:hypothetical protein [Streptomyces sp. SAI-149]|uniref:hypothetical protein n=1 Tax=Streptomyces sp. SAI-149 TaxID=2940542 RepID=UPI002474D53C|nr:hypothetical protein [Streptomyces sp. SAI-149]MDH6497925.1 hypothetical protein [Streptomyces sp. SAI-149]
MSLRGSSRTISVVPAAAVVAACAPVSSVLENRVIEPAATATARAETSVARPARLGACLPN